MSTTIRIKHSALAGAKPTTLKHGEIALNSADGFLFFGDKDEKVVKFSQGGAADQRKFAYDDAVEDGYKDTELAWLKSLQAIKSDAPDDAFTYTRKAERWVRATGNTGRKFAYDDAVDGGYKGTELEWLREKIAPVGDDAPANTKVYGRKDHKWVEVTGGGTTRKTAYEEAVAGGYKGTELEWLHEKIAPVGDDAPSDDKLYARKNGKWVIVDTPKPMDKLITTPVNRVPANNIIIKVNNVDLMASDFSSNRDTPHADSNFQVSTTSDFNGFDLLVDTLEIGGVTHYTFKVEPEFYGQTLYWRVCYIDAVGTESAYSVPTSFTVSSNAVTIS